MRKFLISCYLLTMILIASQTQAGASPRYDADVPKYIQTPDTVETEQLGTLKFFDGMPDDATVQKVYDNLDTLRGIDTFLNGIPAASIYAMREGLKSVGVQPHDIGIFEDLMDARQLFLSANSTTIYITSCFDLRNGPVVLEVPAGVLGPLDDAYFRFVTDVGMTGPDKGKGGKYLLVPPGYKGDLPKSGYFITPTSTYSNWLLMRAFVKDGDKDATVKSVKDVMRVYPFSQAKNPPEQKFVDLSNKKFNTIHANNFEFYEELDAVIQEEPADAFNP
jgi:hypothetical protein